MLDDHARRFVIPVTVDDLAEIWALVQAERDRIGVWMPWVAATRTIDDQRR